MAPSVLSREVPTKISQNHWDKVKNNSGPGLLANRQAIWVPFETSFPPRPSHPPGLPGEAVQGVAIKDLSRRKPQNLTPSTTLRSENTWFEHAWAVQMTGDLYLMLPRPDNSKYWSVAPAFSQSDEHLSVHLLQMVTLSWTKDEKCFKTTMFGPNRQEINMKTWSLHSTWIQTQTTSLVLNEG